MGAQLKRNVALLDQMSREGMIGKTEKVLIG